jgi:hypothetical protein
LRRIVVFLVLAVVTAAVVATALGRTGPEPQLSATAAGGRFFVGLSDTAAFRGSPAQAMPLARGLGVKAFRITLTWRPGMTSIDQTDESELFRLLLAKGDLRPVVAVHGVPGTAPPLTPEAREQFCGYIAGLLLQYPAINDVVIWNEPNKSHFWRPQFGADDESVAPAAYLQLLARCYDVLHGIRPGVNVIAPATSPRGNDDADARTNVSHSPGNFIRKLGAAYRASGRDRPIFDTVGHHVYPEHPGERPWKQHTLSGTISTGDWDELMQALWDSFNGTAQPLPGTCRGSDCTKIWYLEAGYQTQIDADKRSSYHGTENEPRALPDVAAGAPAGKAGADTPAPDQATQIRDAIQRAACQPYVEAFFNFLLVDEAALEGWQSAPFWADGTPKDSYPAFERTIAKTTAGGGCNELQGPAPPAAFTPSREVEVLRVDWPKQQAFAGANDLWRFRLTTAEDATYLARIVRVGARRTIASIRGGSLKEGHHTVITVSKKRLPPGKYRMEVTLASADNPARRTTARGPTFRVKPRAAAPKAPRRRR